MNPHLTAALLTENREEILREWQVPPQLRETVDFLSKENLSFLMDMVWTTSEHSRQVQNVWPNFVKWTLRLPEYRKNKHPLLKQIDNLFTAGMPPRKEAATLWYTLRAIETLYLSRYYAGLYNSSLFVCAAGVTSYAAYAAAQKLNNRDLARQTLLRLASSQP